MSYKYYDNQCGSCYYLRDMRNDSCMFDGPDNEKGHCIELKNCYYPDDSTCSYYKNKDSYVPGSTCFITTIVCNLLGYDDDCSILNTLRGFRNNFMQKDAKYKQALYEYDTVGPIIAKNLEKDYKDEPDKEMVIALYNFYIQPTARLVKENKYEEAVTRYMEMTKSLEDYYGINNIEIAPDDYDYTLGRHGVKKLGSIS